ncbi:MAG: hypothetical protein OEZ39_16485 [Gammaproteobacteria bacterium]|nr:hypothetical protein [Gammaproteobacteria bacterium]MDH5653458.1 hypothetical protein [Gammaproteobacteria bacterium]
MSLTDSPELDKDNDGLIDDYENRLADTWRPYFIFDEHENDKSPKCNVITETASDIVYAACCAAAGIIGCEINSVNEACKFVKKTTCKNNVNDNSLQSFEPVTLFQVRVVDGQDWPRRIKVNYGFLYRLDGGYRGSVVCTDYHYGDTQSGNIELLSDDGVVWRIDALSLWNSTDRRVATDPEIEWTGPRSTYWGKMAQRPSPVIYASAGKHHQYITAGACENEPGMCDDDCGGGATRYANLTPKGLFNNVGEFAHHPADKGVNNPFVNTLAPLGYPNEEVWYARWRCSCTQVLHEDQKDECFTGGTGKNWKASKDPQKCTIPSPAYKMFDLQPVKVPPKGLGLLLPVIAGF